MPHEVWLVRRFLVPLVPAQGDHAVLDKGTSHHVLRVTGVAPGEAVEIFDGQGVRARATLVEVRDGAALLQVAERWSDVRSSRRVHVLMAQTRAPVMDGALRMITELGVTSIRVINTERCVANGDKRARWMRIVEAAAAQSGRSIVPDVRAPLPFVQALQAGSGERLILVPGASEDEAGRGEVSLLIGPEGGLTLEEVAQAEGAGWTPIGLGGTVLRADTAAVVAVARYGR